MRRVPTEKDKKRFRQAIEALNGGRPKEAIRLFDKVRKTGGNHPDIWYLMGLAYGKQGLMSEVRRVSMRALELQPDHFGALCNLANALLTFGDKEGALLNYEKALKVKPNDPTVINNYGRALGLLGRREEAIQHFQSILETNMSYAPAHASLGRAYAEGGYPEKALKAFDIALKLDPSQIDAHMGVANLYSGLGGLPMAEKHYQAAIDAEPGNIDARLGLASMFRFKGDFARAMEILHEAEKHGARSTAVMACKADLLERTQDYDGSMALLKTLKKENRMTPLAVSVYSHLCQRFGVCEEALEMLSKAIEAPQHNISEKQMLRFDMGRLYDRLGRYDEAFESYRLANETIELDSKYSADVKYFKKLKEAFTKKALRSFARSDIDTSRPIFILGMPRSGTSLTEQILACHPDVYGAGELGDVKLVTRTMERDAGIEENTYMELLPDMTVDEINAYSKQYLSSLRDLNADARYVTDKMPHNFLHVGLINLLFPNAKIIHCRRNPLDNGLSIYFQNFAWTHDYAIDLERIGKFYNLYDDLMKHWQSVVDIPILTVQYEEMVEDKEAMSRKIVEFCGLDWSDDVLDFQKSKRAIATASYDQVRQPIYKSSRERWRNYEKYIEPLQRTLEVDF